MSTRLLEAQGDLMLVNPRLLFFLLLGSSTLTAIGLAAACGGTDQNGTTGNSSSSGTGGSAGAGGGDGGGFIFMDGGKTCQSSTECNGQLCIDGVCCDAPEHVCTGICCTGGTVCLFDKCVLPGKNCQTANDCATGQYCETALGDNGATDGGTGDAGASDGGPTCTQAPPLQGKCLDQPPKCDASGNPPGCVQPCEYKPSAGQLNAVVKWSWDQSTATYRPGATDVWSTPTVGRIYDGNCDGKVDDLDSPSVIVVSGRAIDTTTNLGTCCHCTGATNSACLTGALRVLDGRTGAEIWTLDKAEMGSIGFAGTSVAIADIDKDGQMDIAAVTGEGFVVVLDAANGAVKMKSDKAIANAIADSTFGWGGGLAIADMDHDGWAEIAYANSLFTTAGGTLVRKFVGTGAGIGGGSMHEALSTFVDLDGAPDGNLELLAGKTAYKADGTVLWDQTALKDGFPAVGDLDGDMMPDVIIVAAGTVVVLDAKTGATKMGPFSLPGNGAGGPPTVADFDGDKKPEIGVAQQNFYTVLKPNLAMKTLDVVWSVPNHDLSSSVTGSSVFDFEGDGRAEVIYADECFLWVYDGQTGAVRFAASHTSFTGTEASLVADVDGDGRSEIVMVSNSADPSANGWKCMDAAGQPTTVNGATWKPGTAVGKSYRGITLFGDKANSWVGTRTIWNEHTYHVTNICDSRDSACDAPNVYGSVPMTEKKNWTLPWLNNFRQNVQDKGIFDAPDATLSLSVQCASPIVAEVSVRNIGLASLPAGAVIGIFEQSSGSETQVGTGTTTHSLLPGQTEKVSVQLASTNLVGQFIARLVIDPQNPTFHECREDNNESAVVKPGCVN